VKKFLIVWLTLAVTGMGFAQNLIFNGLIEGGIGFFKSDHQDSQLIIGQYNANEGLGSMAQLWVNYSNSNNTAGLRLLFRSSIDVMHDHTDGSNFSVETYEGWLKFFDDMIEVRGGKLDYKDFYNPYGGVEAAMFNGEGWGMIVNVNPFVGFNTRFGIFPAGGLGQGISYKETRYNLGFRYDMFGIANFILNAVVHHEDLYDIGCGIQVVGLKRLIIGLYNFNIDFAALNIMQNKNTSMGIQIGQRADYMSGDIMAGIRCMQFLMYGRGPDLTFAGYIQYALGNKIYPRIHAGINIGSPLRGVNQAGPAGDDFRGGDNFWYSINQGYYYDGLTLNVRGGQADAGNLVIQPSVQLRISGNQFLEPGYTLQRDLSKNKNTRTLNNLFFIDYHIEF